jgi:hypothetical protein
MRVGIFVIVAAGLAACGTTGTDEGSYDAAAPTGSDAATSFDATPANDAARDGDATVSDAGSDAVASALDVELRVDTLFQNCMPIVAKDPITFQGTLTITNKSAVPLGPLTFATGKFLGAQAGAPLATFDVDATSGTIAPSEKRSIVVEKVAGSLSPANGCQTVACNSEVTVELAYGGAGAPAGAVVRAKAQAMSCAF